MSRGLRPDIESALVEAYARRVAEALRDEDRKPKYRGHPNPMTGQCYVASEALLHLLDPAAKLKPMSIRHEGDVHWFLRAPTGEPVDITASQFTSPVPYERARGRGFLTKEPSKRAAAVMKRVRSSSRPTVRATVRGHELRLEVAADPESRARGLSGRSHVPDGTGMLFVFPEDEPGVPSPPRVFWMKSTSVPLEVAFLDDAGRIEEIVPLEPFDETPVTSASSGRYAIEMPCGWFAARGVGVGDVVHFHAP